MIKHITTDDLRGMTDREGRILQGFVSETQEKQLPDCPIIGADGNVFNLIGIASRTLKQNGMSAQAKEMSERAFVGGSYDAALA
jgi:hypothetical protein